VARTVLNGSRGPKRISRMSPRILMGPLSLPDPPGARVSRPFPGSKHRPSTYWGRESMLTQVCDDGQTFLFRFADNLHAVERLQLTERYASAYSLWWS
jgi:hypothetical protein